MIMAEYLSPGVYVEEYDNSQRAIEGVGTSTAGFIGMAMKGPTKGAPVLVTSFTDFQKQFGDFLSEYQYEEFRYLAFAVEQFFQNGGTRCFVSRVIPEDATIASAQSGILHVKAKNEGTWGNRISLRFSTVMKKKMQILEKSGEATYLAKSVDGFREGDLVKLGEEINRISVISEQTITFEKAFQEDPVDTNLIPKKFIYALEMDISVRYKTEVENYKGVTLNPLSPNYLPKKLLSSQMVEVEMDEVQEIVQPVEAILGPDMQTGELNLSDGKDGNIYGVTAATFIGEDRGPGKRTGIQSFLENNTISMLAIPGITMPEVMVSLVAHCENMQNRVAVLDMPKDMVRPNELIEYRNMIDSTYAAMYHPWIQVFDRTVQKPGMIPPSGAVMGVYSRTDTTKGVHKAPANELVQCTGLSIAYTAREQDILNPAGINLIRAIPGQGIRIWGARTASSNSAFKYINIRRLFIFVEESIRATTNWVVFEPNNVSLWTRVQMTISSFLENLWRSGVLSGGSAEEAYFVNIGTDTMTQADIMNGRLICEIGIAPSRPAEFVIFRVTQHTAEAGEAQEAAEE